MLSTFFFFNDTATTEIYTLSLHDALPISYVLGLEVSESETRLRRMRPECIEQRLRSEEHTSELQSPDHLVCRLLLEKKKNQSIRTRIDNLKPLRNDTYHYAADH